MIKKILVLVIPLGMTACHAFISAPWLLQHHSSAAFETMVAGWVIIGFAWFLLWPRKERDERQTE
jgi:hypothetical protein